MTVVRIRPKLKYSNPELGENVNKHLTELRSGYQDLVDRYGPDDALVRDLKDEIERCQQQDAATVTERRKNSSLVDAWERHSEIASL